MVFDATYENAPRMGVTELSSGDGIPVWDTNGGGDGLGAPKTVSPYVLSEFLGFTQLGGTSGTQIGSAAAQKYGFWGATPIVQPAAAAQATISNSTGGTPGVSLLAFPGTATVSLTALTNNLASLWNLQNAMRTALVDAGIMKGSA